MMGTNLGPSLVQTYTTDPSLIAVIDDIYPKGFYFSAKLPRSCYENCSSKSKDLTVSSRHRFLLCTYDHFKRAFEDSL